MGLSINSRSLSSLPQNHQYTHKIFLLCNYIIPAQPPVASFLLSLRLIPTVCGVFLILLHIFTIGGAISGCSVASAGSNRWYAAHMVATVLTAIFQGSVSVLIFTRTSDFLGELKSYVREDDGSVILKLGGGLCVLMFCLEWLVLVLAFVLRYYAFVDGDLGNNGAAVKRSERVRDEDLKDWPWPFQV
ncbi:hypothetical protein RJ641_021796 [Dillenia turbinata]|uniref:Uncharacterized protein n=1 Tax=Dillenia turbinata TaxID=194707 RepID=A0AAN8YW27_9MAGN